MKKLIAIVGLLVLVSCGNDEVLLQTVEKEVEVLKEVEVTKEVYKAQDFEGFYFCDNNSSLELLTDHNNRVTFDTYGQSMNSINPQNDTLGTHPVISERDVLIKGNRLIIPPKNYNYSSSTYDIEEDDTGSNITGKKRTDVIVEKSNDDSITVEFVIYSNAINQNINWIVANRKFTCEK